MCAAGTYLGTYLALEKRASCAQVRDLENHASQVLLVGGVSECRCKGELD